MTRFLESKISSSATKCRKKKSRLERKCLDYLGNSNSQTGLYQIATVLPAILWNKGPFHFSEGSLWHIFLKVLLKNLSILPESYEEKLFGKNSEETSPIIYKKNSSSRKPTKKHP